MKKISLVIVGLAFATYGFSQGNEKTELKVQSAKTTQHEGVKAEKVNASDLPIPTKKAFNNYKIDKKSSLKLEEGSQKVLNPADQEKKAVEPQSDVKATEIK